MLDNRFQLSNSKLSDVFDSIEFSLIYRHERKEK